MKNNTKNPGSLIDAVDAVRSQKIERKSRKNNLLEPHLADLGLLVSEGVPLSSILQGLSDVGVEISKSYLGVYLRQNFPDDYQKNYTDRLVGGRKKGASNNKKKTTSSRGRSKKEVPDTNSAKTSNDAKHSSGKQSESSEMISSYIEQRNSGKG